MMKFKRIFTIVIDSFGIGAMPDADRYDDAGCDTLGHIDECCEHLHIPNLERLGLGSLHTVRHSTCKGRPEGYQARLSEASIGKDTMTGHWEMMGLHITEPFRTFTEHGFPEELIKELSLRCAHPVIGNKAASGTAILDELAEKAIAENAMIVYTSADSVLQICGNEETFGLEELYRCCRIARELTLKKEWRVGRVIARPYVGRKKGEFLRTSNRHDYALKPSGKTALNALQEQGLDVISIGKIRDIFDGEGITQAYRSASSVQGMEQTISFLEKDFHGLCFTNLVDFDALWGHRRNPGGYAGELERFDKLLGDFLRNMTGDDLLMITADHGNDPTFKGTDHTREYVPLLMYSPAFHAGGKLPDQDTFAVVGCTIAHNFGVDMPENTIGSSLLPYLK